MAELEGVTLKLRCGMLLKRGLERSPRWAGGGRRAWMTIKVAGLGRKTRSIEEQMAKLREKVKKLQRIGR